MIASKGDSKMSWRRGKTSGWAAFDQQQRQKDNPDVRPSNEAFPSLSSTVKPEKTFSRNRQRQVKSFSSVILPSLDFAAPLKEDLNCKSSGINSSEGPQVSQISLNNKNDLVSRQLKELFDWADDSLIEDIMASAGGDFDKASSFLKAMVYDQSSPEHENVQMNISSFSIMEPVTNGKLIPAKRDASLKDMSESPKTWSVLKPCVGNNIENVTNDITLSAEKLFDDCMEFNAMLGELTSVPVEPEWEEDDVYLSSRKDAIKMMRAAARHSKAATNSFLRGDHISAQQFSLKAREEWGAAQSLNAKAACDILSIRNEKNGIWRLDLHGLHASEAVQAVKERLHMIETQMLSEGSRSSELPNRFRTKTEEWCGSYPDGCNNLENSDKRALNRLKPTWLEIITGIGNHSRGGAALPTAVRTFLADNRYRFDEARPGAIMVRPKFRLS
ncbi:uncharacterized protein LOC110736679 [Chenopodium quinoa]|uniref:uncharacterized protein LOC110736679 n=1 Tax=Chenopodium quinoa TaxID=63459 RepID=UPI000B793113|nr:uncharacterized protein LOC110736679 [Chenopodium quinoa]XP_021772665.1 uncharacterized protein LOC110736679 [Chenopodium quinoa]